MSNFTSMNKLMVQAKLIQSDNVPNTMYKMNKSAFCFLLTTFGNRQQKYIQ